MRITAGVISIVTVIVGLIGSAVAADMTAADIKAFAIGKTVYLETTGASVTGQAGRGSFIGQRTAPPSTKRLWGPCGPARGKSRAICFAPIGSRDPLHHVDAGTRVARRYR